MAHKLAVADRQATDESLQAAVAGANDTKVKSDEAKVKIEASDDINGQWNSVSSVASLRDYGDKFTNPILNNDSDADKRRYRQLIDGMKYTRWWDDIEESYADFERRFCEEIEYNIKSIRSKHFPITKLIRHYEVDTAISAFVKNSTESKRAIGVYIGYTSQGPFSRMFDETVTSPERKNRQGNFRTIKRFILDLLSVPEESRASFTEKVLVRKYLNTYGSTVINSSSAATFDRQDGWVYLTFHEHLNVGGAGAANAIDAGAAASASKINYQTPTSAQFLPDPALHAPEVALAFTRTSDNLSYTCIYCNNSYKATKAGLSVPARKHYLICPTRLSLGAS